MRDKGCRDACSRLHRWSLISYPSSLIPYPHHPSSAAELRLPRVPIRRLLEHEGAPQESIFFKGRGLQVQADG